MASGNASRRMRVGSTNLRIRKMKKCLQCLREYFDETLNYCLDDGVALLHGPASADEPETGLLHNSGAAINETTPPMI
jgi:hypothetical protein